MASSLQLLPGSTVQYECLDNPPTKKQMVNEGTDEELVCIGYKTSCVKTFLFHTLALLLLGFPYLLIYWNRSWRLVLRCRKCFLLEADYVLLKDAHGQHSVEQVTTETVSRSFPDEFVHECSDEKNVTDRTHLCKPEHYLFKFFIHQHIKFAWNSSVGSFQRLDGYSSNIENSALLEKCQGHTKEEQLNKLQLYGQNSVSVQVKSYWKLFLEEGLNPFYFFQIFSIIFWCLDEYVYYAACIFIISVVSLTATVWEVRKQSETLHKMVSSSTLALIKVFWNNGESEDIQVSNLVPGDVIEIPANGCIMPCDAVLISGNCIVNESMLTGESVPVTKTPLPPTDEIYSADKQKRHTLFAGTHVIQTRYYKQDKVQALVVRTGFTTAKGELVRSILFPKPMGFKFYKDSMYFVLFLFCLAAIGMMFCVYLYIMRKAEISVIVLRTLDIVTIVVPPALPAAMTVGIVYAQSRLKKKGIYCISPLRINVCGKVKLVCFDKTGTLTEEGLDLWAVVPADNGRFDTPIPFVSSLPLKSNIIEGMATCHSLTYIEGNMTGDPLDIKMFEATGWILEEPGTDTTNFDIMAPTIVKPAGETTASNNDLLPINGTDIKVPYEIGIVQQFPFTSNLQRMSVIVRSLGNKRMELYCKGAPEKIQSLCREETMPANFSETLMSYTMNGFRVIALAHRVLRPKLTWHHAQRVKREQVECDLDFLGLLIMQNTLKRETAPVIQELRSANIRTVMVTGDNILTAASVARECGMIPVSDRVVLVTAHAPEDGNLAWLKYESADSSTDCSVNLEASDVCIKMEGLKLDYHFAVSGKSWSVLRRYFPDLVPKILTRGTVFARMAPDQKAQLVESLQELGYIVGMCGDGANDCGALKAAHVGISLSEAEASVAAPFTSKVPNIMCVPSAIREGRCALVTSFSVFKYMALYSMVQFMSVLILYTQYSNFGDIEFLYIDLFVITTLAVVMGKTEAHDVLVAKRPMGSLISFPNILSILLQIIIAFGFQGGTLLYLVSQRWYHHVPQLQHEEPVTLCWENTIIFSVSSFQYLILAFAFSIGRPYRKPFYTNALFLASLLILTGVTALLAVHPGRFLTNVFELQPYPENTGLFVLTIIMLVAMNFVLSCAVEDLIVNSTWLKAVSHVIMRKKQPKNPYKQMEKFLLSQPSWPPVGQTEYAPDIS